MSDSVPLKEGFITLQAEGSSTQFRKIEVLDLVGCMDKTKPGYRSYFVKNDNTLCNVTTTTSKAHSPIENLTVVRSEKNILVSGHQITQVELLDMSGKVIEARSASSGASFSLSIAHPSLYIVRIVSKSGTQLIKVPFY